MNATSILALSGGLAGLFQFETGKIAGVDADGNEIITDHEVLVPWFNNLLTDGGMDLLGTSSADNLAYCRLGTGSTAPAFGNTALGAQVGSTTAIGTGETSGVNAGGGYIYRRVSRRFTAGTVSGVALAEVGMGATASGAIFSRSLIKEAGGSPITITVPADQFLDVIYELRYYIDMADVSFAATIDGVASTVTIRKHGAITASPWTAMATVLGSGLWFTFNANNRRTLYCLENQPAAATVPGYVGSGFITPTRTYTPGSYQVKLTADLGLSEYNFATGIGAIILAQSDLGATSLNGAWSWGFSPKIAKDAGKLSTIEIGLSWARYTIP